MIGKLINLYYSIKYRFLDKRILIGDGSFIHNHATFIVADNQDARISIGKGTYIGRYINLHTNSKIVIGDNCVLSDYIYISTLSHGLEPDAGRILDQEDYDKGEVTLGENVFIGFGSMIMPNISLGNWCVVGAGSVVTKSFPEFCMIAGNPAKLVKVYDRERKKWMRPSEINQKNI